MLGIKVGRLGQYADDRNDDGRRRVTFYDLSRRQGGRLVVVAVSYRHAEAIALALVKQGQAVKAGGQV